MITLGWTYKDKVTGFEGMATGRVEYLTGCHQVLLNPTVDKEGKLRDANWFDEQRLETVPTIAPMELDNSSTPGPDKQAPKY
jgi:hypothetical protein